MALQEILGAGIEAFRSYFNLGLNFNSMREPLVKDITAITIDALNILTFERDERLVKIKTSCAILLFALAMPNENKSVIEKRRRFINRGLILVQRMVRRSSNFCHNQHRNGYHVEKVFIV